MISTDEIDISIVIPARNEERYLAECLEAIAAQRTQRRIEVIVVDNGSTDRTQEIARVHGVRVVEEPVQGVGSARRAGTALARGRYVLHIDADTRLPHSFVEKALERFHAEPTLVCVGGQMVWYDAPQYKNTIRAFLFMMLVPLVRLVSHGALGPMGNNMMFPRSVYEQCKGFDLSLKFGEDADLTRQLSRYGDVVLDLSLHCPTSSRRYQWNTGLCAYLWNGTRVCLGLPPRTNELRTPKELDQHSSSSIDN